MSGIINTEYKKNLKHARLAELAAQEHNLCDEDYRKIRYWKTHNISKKVESKKQRIIQAIENINKIQNWQKIKTRFLMDLVHKGIDLDDIDIDADINTIKTNVLEKIKTNITELLEQKNQIYTAEINNGEINNGEINEQERIINRVIIKLLQLKANIESVNMQSIGPYADPENISDLDKQNISKKIDEEISNVFHNWGIATEDASSSHALWSISVLEKRLYVTGKTARTKKSIVKAKQILINYIKEYKNDIDNPGLNKKLNNSDGNGDDNSDDNGDSKSKGDPLQQYRIIQTHIFDCLKKENIEVIVKQNLTDRKNSLENVFIKKHLMHIEASGAIILEEINSGQKHLDDLTPHEQSKLAFYNLYCANPVNEEQVNKLFDDVGSLDYKKGQEYALKMSEGEANASAFLLWGNMVGGVKNGRIDPKEYFVHYIKNEAGTIIKGCSGKFSDWLLDLYNKQIIDKLLRRSIRGSITETSESRTQMNLIHEEYKNIIKSYPSNHLRITDNKINSLIYSRGLGMLDTHGPGSHNFNLVIRSLFKSINTNDMNLYTTFRDERNHYIQKYLFYIKTLNQLKVSYPENYITVISMQNAEIKINQLISEASETKEDIHVTNIFNLEIKNLKLQLENQLFKIQITEKQTGILEKGSKELELETTNAIDYNNTASIIISKEALQMKKILCLINVTLAFKKNLRTNNIPTNNALIREPIRPSGPPPSAWYHAKTIIKRKITHNRAQPIIPAS